MDPPDVPMAERLELPPRTTMAGVPHISGTREYLTCEEGTVQRRASRERFDLVAGDVVVSRGDGRHSHASPRGRRAVAYSIVVRTRT